MDPSLRNLKGLEDKIKELQSTILKRYQNLMRHAAIHFPKPESPIADRTSTAVTQYQIQTETAALIRAAEDVQTLIRQMQEMWLFGQLNTLDETDTKKQADENAEVVKDLLKLLHQQRSAAEDQSNS